MPIGIIAALIVLEDLNVGEISVKLNMVDMQLTSVTNAYRTAINTRVLRNTENV